MVDTRSYELLKFYEDQHRNVANRWVHHLAHLVAVLGIIGVFVQPLIGIAMILLALPLSWLGHFAFERNVPAFFDNTTRGGLEGGVRKKAAIALGGIFWSAACFGRVLGFGPLVKLRKD